MMGEGETYSFSLSLSHCIPPSARIPAHYISLVQCIILRHVPDTHFQSPLTHTILLLSSKIRPIRASTTTTIFAEDADYEAQFKKLQQEAEIRLEEKVQELMKNVETVGSK